MIPAKLRRPVYALFVLLFVLLSAVFAVHAFRYLYAEASAGNAFHRSFAMAGWPVPLHFFGAGLALLVAPLTLSARLRTAQPAIHRMIGWLYVLSVGLAALAGFILSFRAQTGWAAGSSFLLLSLVWFAVTATALSLAIRRRVAAHRRWMLRSAALTFSAVTLRLYLIGGLALAHWSFATAYIVAAWACWTLNLAAMELYLRHHAASRSPSHGKVRPRSNASGIGLESRPAGA